MSDRTADRAVSPYQRLDARAFWRSGVTEAGAYPPPDIFRPKFPVTRAMPVMTAGSCFAQHVGRAMKTAGFSVLDTEPLPEKLPEDVAQAHGYNLYSARYGNIYTVRQLLQLLQECRGEFAPAKPVWEKDGRYYDALRPGVEPAGLGTPELVTQARAAHLKAVWQAVEQAELLVFTLGLTETWEHVASGTVYPTAPGTIAGQISDEYAFRNFRHAEIRADFEAARAILKSVNPGLKFLLTVSPVPLTATASGDHILPATIYSKSVLRAVTGELYQDFDDIDYFPSYEIVASHAAGGDMYEQNLRSVQGKAVARVMAAFLTAHGVEPDAIAMPGKGKAKGGGKRRAAIAAKEQKLDPDARQAFKKARAERRAERKQAKAMQPADTAEVVCEEQLLEAFRK